MQAKFSTFLLVLGVCAMMFPATSYGQHHHGKKGAHHTQKMKEHLDLTDAQVKQMDAMSEKYMAKIKDLHANEDMDSDARHAAMQKIKTDKKAEFFTILNEDQKAKAEEMFSKKGHHGGHHGHGMDMKKMHGDPAKFKAAKKEMHAYMQENILPVVKKERIAFEQKLSAKDKKTIANMRGAMENHHAEMRKSHPKEGCAPEGKSCEGKCHGTKAKGKKHAHHGEISEAMMAHKKEVHALVEKYDADLNESMEKLEPNHEQWMTDMKAIFKKHLGEDVPPHAMHHLKDMKKMRKGRFLMLDPDAKSLPGMDDELEEFTATIFPNPANEVTNMAFKIKNPGTVSIEMLDLEGKLVKKVIEEKFEAGEYQQEVDISDVENGVYLLRLTSPDGSITQRFVKEN